MWHRGAEPVPPVGWLAAALAAALLAGCGLGGAGETTASGTTPAPTTAAPTGPAGTPEAAALSGFHCQPDSDGSWSAIGTVTNHSDERADYVVTVVVAAAEDLSARGEQLPIRDLGSGDSYDLRLRRLPAPAAGGLTCQAQVLRR